MHDVHGSAAGNRAVQIGGGIYDGGGLLKVVNATISGNSAPQGGGIATGFAANATIGNSTIVLNQGGGVTADVAGTAVINTIV